MKRLISLFMALLIVAVLPVSAFAAEANEGNDVVEGTVQYYVGSTYTIEIPEKIDLTSNFSFNLTESNLAPNASITIGLYDFPESGLYTLNHTSLENTSIQVKLTTDENLYGDYDPDFGILSVINYGDISSSPFKAELVAEEGTVTAAGMYSGTVTFKFTLNDTYYG